MDDSLKNGRKRRGLGRKGLLGRFWAKVHCQPHGCWLWTASLKAGYGQFHIAPGIGEVQAHRFSYQISNGLIPAGLFVCHACDNPLCVRPDHLWMGTATDNQRDMRAKGRAHDQRVKRKEMSNV